MLHRVGVSWYVKWILKTNEQYDKPPAAAAFGHRHTEALRNGKKWRFVKNIKHLK